MSRGGSINTALCTKGAELPTTVGNLVLAVSLSSRKGKLRSQLVQKTRRRQPTCSLPMKESLVPAKGSQSTHLAVPALVLSL